MESLALQFHGRVSDALDSLRDETMTVADTAGSAQLTRQQAEVIGLIADALDQERFENTVLALVGTLATSFQCHRVSVGWLHGKLLRVEALSNSSEFELQSSLVKAISAAMDETIQHGDSTIFPSDDVIPTTAHAALARAHGQGSICTVPLVHRDVILGAITLERASANRFLETECNLIEYISLLLSPILDLKSKAEAGVTQRLLESNSDWWSKVLGPKHLLAKLLLIVITCIASIMLSVTGAHRVTAFAALEARDARAVVSPTNGFIARVHHRAGDVVKAGTPLAELDQRDLMLELEKWQNESSKIAREQHAALASRDRNQLRVLKSSANQVKSQMQLLETLIERGELVSPIDGVIILGDHSQNYGSPVERGDVLFEIAPLGTYRLMLKVDEGDVTYLREDQTGHLLLSGRPDAPIAFHVKSVMPISETFEGENVFSVEAELLEDPAWARPGMVGVAKVSIGEESLAWIWTHRIVDAARLAWWKLGS